MFLYDFIENGFCLRISKADQCGEGPRGTCPEGLAQSSEFRNLGQFGALWFLSGLPWDTLVHLWQCWPTLGYVWSL